MAIHVRSEAPHAKLALERLGLAGSSAPVDPGILQPNGLDIDREASLAAHRAFLEDWDNALERESDFLRDEGARLVAGDVPALAFAAAGRAGVPSVAITNFSWDWILEPWADADPGWQPVVDAYRKAYGQATLLLRLPFAGELSAFPSVRDVPLLTNLSMRSRAECREALGIAPDETRRLVLVSFGGFGGIATESAPDEDLSRYLFVCSDAPPPGHAGAWLRVSTSDALPHEDVIHACDALIGKPGYSTVAEALAHRIRYLCLPREGFREAPLLWDGLARQGGARRMPRSDFAAGRWRAHLDAVFTLPRPPAVPADGADAVADVLLEMLRR